MNTSRNEFFAGAAFTNHQHWPVQLGHAGNPLQYLEENRRFTDQWLFLLAVHLSSALVCLVVIVRKMTDCDKGWRSWVLL